jgi:hypothetical protein
VCVWFTFFCVFSWLPRRKEKESFFHKNSFEVIERIIYLPSLNNLNQRHVFFPAEHQMELPRQSFIATECDSYVQSLSLADDIHRLCDRLNKVSIAESTFVKNLEEWRNDAHQIIDHFCKSKCDEYMKRTNEEIDQLKETVASLSSDHDDAAEDYIDWVKETIQSIHQQLDELQQIQCEFSPLKIENSIITFPPPMCDVKRQLTPLKDLFSSSFDFETTISLKSPKQKMKFPSDHWYSLATNDTHLLITGKSDLFLIDHSLTIINKKSFLQIGIKDICWSKNLSRFILISPKEIFLLDEKFISLELSSITLITNNPWERGTCSGTILFLSTFGENPFIIEYHLFPSIHFNKKYQSAMICGESEVINEMKSNEISLALIIENGFNNQSRLELRSIKSFECIWSIHLGKGWNYRCSALNNYHWIVTDSYNHRIIQISNNGIIQKTENYSSKPLNVVHWGEDQIVIRTKEGLYVHQYK